MYIFFFEILLFINWIISKIGVLSMNVRIKNRFNNWSKNDVDYSRSLILSICTFQNITLKKKLIFMKHPMMAVDELIFLFLLNNIIAFDNSKNVVLFKK